MIKRLDSRIKEKQRKYGEIGIVCKNTEQFGITLNLTKHVLEDSVYRYWLNRLKSGHVVTCFSNTKLGFREDRSALTLNSEPQGSAFGLYDSVGKYYDFDELFFATDVLEDSEIEPCSLGNAKDFEYHIKTECSTNEQEELLQILRDKCKVDYTEIKTPRQKEEKEVNQPKKKMNIFTKIVIFISVVYIIKYIKKHLTNKK